MNCCGIRWMVVLLTAALVGGSAYVGLNTGTASQAVAAAAEDKTDLHEHMEEMDRRMRMLRRTLRSDEHKEQSLQFIAELQQYTLKSKGLTPSMAENVPSGERDAFIADYRREMAKMLIATLELEIAVLDGDADKTRELYQAIAGMEEPGHEKFMEQ